MIEELRRTGNKAALSSLKFAAEALKEQNEKIEALLRVARAAKNLKEEAWDSAKPCSEHWPWEDGLKEALKEVEDLLK